MLKIFVTGDNHIGHQFANKSKGKEMIAERLNAIDRMITKANEEKCDLFAVTGDLFHKTDIDGKTVKDVADRLAKFIKIVAVLPGNHDYYTPQVEVWKTFSDAISRHGNIKLLNTEEPYARDNWVIYPAICNTYDSMRENALGWIKGESFPNDGKYRIGMAHGAVEGETPDENGKYFPMTYDELNGIGVDVWLVGHTHVPFPRDLTEEFTDIKERKVFNAGTHAPADVTENTEGLGFILEIDENKKIRAKKFVSGTLPFYRKEIDVSAGRGKLEDILTNELRGYKDRAYVEIILKGAVSDEDFEKRYEIIDRALERFLDKEYKEGYSNISAMLTKEKILALCSETTLYADMLLELLSDQVQAQMAFDLLTGKDSDNGNKEKKK